MSVNLQWHRLQRVSVRYFSIFIGWNKGIVHPTFIYFITRSIYACSQEDLWSHRILGCSRSRQEGTVPVRTWQFLFQGLRKWGVICPISFIEDEIGFWTSIVHTCEVVSIQETPQGPIFGSIVVMIEWACFFRAFLHLGCFTVSFLSAWRWLVAVCCWQNILCLSKFVSHGLLSWTRFSEWMMFLICDFNFFLYILVASVRTEIEDPKKSHSERI